MLTTGPSRSFIIYLFWSFIFLFPASGIMTAYVLGLHSFKPKLMQFESIYSKIRLAFSRRQLCTTHFSTSSPKTYTKAVHNKPPASVDMEMNSPPRTIPRTLAITSSEEDPDLRKHYRPFILPSDTTDDWVDKLDLGTVMNMAENQVQGSMERLKILVLYGSLRKRSYSRLVAYETSRILFRLGCDVRIFDPEGLPIKNDNDQSHPKVQELRELSTWSDGHVWVSPEQHGNLVSICNTFSSKLTLMNSLFSIF